MNELMTRQDLILLAEDNPMDAVLIRHSLVEHAVEHTMLIMEDGQEAIDYIDRTEADETEAAPDRPRRSAFACATRLRRRAAGLKTLCIML